MSEDEKRHPLTTHRMRGIKRIERENWIIDHIYKGTPYRDVLVELAEKFNIAEATARDVYHKALNKLKEQQNQDIEERRAKLNAEFELARKEFRLKKKGELWIKATALYMKLNGLEKPQEVEVTLKPWDEYLRSKQREIERDGVEAVMDAEVLQLIEGDDG